MSEKQITQKQLIKSSKECIKHYKGEISRLKKELKDCKQNDGRLVLEGRICTTKEFEQAIIECKGALANWKKFLKNGCPIDALNLAKGD